MTDSKEHKWMKVAWVIAQFSSCHRDQVGAVILSTDHRIVGTGYNGQPSGFPEDCISCPRRSKKGVGLDDSYSDCTSIHAEANALLYSDMSRRQGGTMFVTRAPCWGCCKLIANSGVLSVVIPREAPIKPEVQAYLATSGIRLRQI